MPVLGLFMRFGLTGTGFAQPNPVSSNKTAPTGSTCENGLKVSLPLDSAVSSPHRRATHAWANSCRGRINRMIITLAMSIMRICCLSMENKLICTITSYVVILFIITDFPFLFKRKMQISAVQKKFSKKEKKHLHFFSQYDIMESVSLFKEVQ